MTLASQSPFATRLLEGEHILWEGRPKQGVLFSTSDIFFIPFSLLWCGGAIFWETGVAKINASPFFLLFGAFFVCMGLFIVVGRFFVDAWLRQDMRYAVTTKRILIERPAPFARFVALGLDKLPECELSERQNGRGTIRFGAQPPMWGRGAGPSMVPSMEKTPQFLAIDNVREVFDLVQRTASHSRL
jgi:hypothetical protein